MTKKYPYKRKKAPPLRGEEREVALAKRDAVTEGLDQLDGRWLNKNLRITRAKELLLEQIQAKKPIVRSHVADAIADEFGVSWRCGMEDAAIAWTQVRESHAAEIAELENAICRSLGEYVHGLADLVERCVEAGDRKVELEARKEIGKARQLLAPDVLRVEVARAPVNLDALSDDELRGVLDGIRKARELAAARPIEVPSGESH